MIDDPFVRVNKCSRYDNSSVFKALPGDLFEVIKPGASVILKPNWVLEAHKNRPSDWEYVITHPVVIDCVIEHVFQRLGNSGRISILDGPMTEASFAKIIEHYPVNKWRERAELSGITLEIIDLRDHEWQTQYGVTVKRINLPGDPRGKVIVDLKKDLSEFHGHVKSKRGYYGADYDRMETNRAHDGYHNLYSVSRTVIEGDVFINIPKLKTHRKAGITSCLKNLVGINTYKNYLPHHSEGGPCEGGDQFSGNNINSKFEGPLISFVKQHVIKNQYLAKFISPFYPIGKIVFGESDQVVRNGSWHGNDTLWRMILDLNKILFYAGQDGIMRSDCKNNAKSYIGIVDAIVAGDGNGPLSPDPVEMGYLICGKNPVAIDSTCAMLMGYDPMLIPSISNAFKIRNYLLCNFSVNDIQVIFNSSCYNIFNYPEAVVSFKPPLGWCGHIESKAEFTA